MAGVVVCVLLVVTRDAVKQRLADAIASVNAAAFAATLFFIEMSFAAALIQARELPKQPRQQMCPLYLPA